MFPSPAHHRLSITPHSAARALMVARLGFDWQKAINDDEWQNWSGRDIARRCGVG